MTNSTTFRRPDSSTTVGVALVALALAAWPCPAQIGAVAGFPSANPSDGQFLSLVDLPSGLVGQQIRFGLSVPVGRSDFNFLIFDGDTGKNCDPGTDPTCFIPSLGHWDSGDTQIVVRMYADPTRSGSESPADLVGEWYGNASNPTVDPAGAWTGDAEMLDNRWWVVNVVVAANALAPSGAGFYNVVIDLDEPGDGRTVSNFKVAADVPLTVYSSDFGFEAALGGGPNDLGVIYPGYVFGSPFDFATGETTYDGRISYFLEVAPGTTELRLFDGDFDHGTGSLTGLPSGQPIAPCADSDDLDSPSLPAFAGPNAVPQAAQGAGQPSDDSRFDALRRSPCIRYTVTDPLGQVYTNLNPSGNTEWEQFLITSDPAATATTADYGLDFAEDGSTFVQPGSLPAGVWKVEVEGLDVGNSNYWSLTLPACGLVDGAALCPPGPYLIGDYVWYDDNQDGVQDAGEAGIRSVKLEFVGTDGQVLGTGLTDGGGNYDRGVPPGTHTVRVAIENFTVVRTGSVGDRVWFDVDGDGSQGAGEPGLVNVTVRLEDPATGKLLATTVTDADGGYLFSGLAAGSYRVRVVESTLPAGLTLSGGTNPSASRTITVQEMHTDLDFGYTLADPLTTALGDYVWIDANSDGLQDSTESAAGGVLMELLDDTSTVIATLRTTDGGQYLFTQLPTGTFQVRVAAANFGPGGVLEGYAATAGPESEGSNLSASRFVMAGVPELGVDFGYVRAGLLTITDRVWYDADSNGAFDTAAGDSALAGVTVRLLDGSGAYLATTTTDADGQFTFPGLQGGGEAYWIEITDETGLTSGLIGTTQPGLDGRLLVILDAAGHLADSFGYDDQGRLIGLQSTTGGDSITDTVVDANVLTYDFGYWGGDMCALGGRPHKIEMEYRGDPCSSPAAQNNDQTTDTCTGALDYDQPVEVRMLKKPERFIVNPTTETIMIGDLFTIESSDPNGTMWPQTEVGIFQGGVMIQKVVLHTSCSEPLNPGDQFGSILLRGYYHPQ